jgi:hypothetical protein
MHCYETLGRTDELANLQRQWGSEELVSKTIGVGKPQ